MQRSGSSALESLTGATPRPAEPLFVHYPSPMTIVTYPLLAANVRILCDKDTWRQRGSSSLTTIFVNVRKTFRSEGMLGVYRGAHIFFLHQALRDVFKLLAERGIQAVERRVAAPRGQQDPECAGGTTEGDRQKVVGYRARLATKYLIEGICYPVLFAATRVIIVHDDTQSTWQHISCWRKEEGALVLFGGLCASLLSTALDEIMEWVLAWCIDYCAADSEIEMSDKLLIKASGSSVVSLFTAPVNYVGVIQRCQSSKIKGFPPPESVPELVMSLPWRASLYQFALYGGIMALNVRLVQWKIKIQSEQQEDYE